MLYPGVLNIAALALYLTFQGNFTTSHMQKGQWGAEENCSNCLRSHPVSSDLLHKALCLHLGIQISHWVLPSFAKWEGFLLYALSLRRKVWISWNPLNWSNATNSCQKFLIQKSVNIMQKMGLKLHCAARPHFLGYNAVQFHHHCALHKFQVPAVRVPSMKKWRNDTYPNTCTDCPFCNFSRRSVWAFIITIHTAVFIYCLSWMFLHLCEGFSLYIQHQPHEQFEATHNNIRLLDHRHYQQQHVGFVWFDSQRTDIVSILLRETSVLLKLFLIAC